MEQNDITISAHDVAMRFRLTDDKILSLKEFVTRKIRGKIKTNEFWALKGVSFDVHKGEVLGVIRDVFGNEIAQVCAPFDGIVYGYCDYPVVQPGNWSYLFAKVDN